VNKESLGLHQKFDGDEPGDKEDAEQDDQTVEVQVDEAFDRAAKPVDEPRDEEESEATAENRREDKDPEVDVEHPGREGEHLIGDRRQAREEHRGEAVRIVEFPYPLERDRCDAGYVAEEPVLSNVPASGPDRISDDAAEYGSQGADPGEPERFPACAQTKREKEWVRR